MKLLRNPEMQRELLLLGAFSLLSTAAMGFWQGFRAAMGAGGICLIFIGIFYVINVMRYHKVSDMGEQIDKILHGEHAALMDNCSEGEFAILSTQIRKMVRRLQEQQNILQQEKELLADSMADISHQMKTPLTSIHLILSFLSEKDISCARRQALAKKLTVLTDRMDWMVYALLRMAKLEAGVVTLQRQHIDMESLVKKCYEVLAVSLDVRGISFRSEVEEGAGMVGDMAWMAEALTNVIKNCMEHTPEGGEVFVKVLENPLCTVIFVEDTGGGIAEEDLPHIFERFYRGKNADENSAGIGLALSRQIIVSHNGTIKAYNKRRGSGAVFEVRCYKGAV